MMLGAKAPDFDAYGLLQEPLPICNVPICYPLILKFFVIVIAPP